MQSRQQAGTEYNVKDLIGRTGEWTDIQSKACKKLRKKGGEELLGQRGKALYIPLAASCFLKRPIHSHPEDGSFICCCSEIHFGIAFPSPVHCSKGERNVKLRIVTWSWPGLGASWECQQCAWLIFVRYTVWIQAVSLVHSEDDPGMLIFPWPTHITWAWYAHVPLACPQKMTQQAHVPLAYPQMSSVPSFFIGTPTEDSHVTLILWHTHRRWPRYAHVPLAHPQKMTRYAHVPLAHPQIAPLRSYSVGTRTEDGPVTLMFRWHTNRRWPRYAHVPLAHQHKMAPVILCSVGPSTEDRPGTLHVPLTHAQMKAPTRSCSGLFDCAW
jgi:hypothetical protein